MVDGTAAVCEAHTLPVVPVHDLENVALVKSLFGTHIYEFSMFGSDEIVKACSKHMLVLTKLF